MKLLEVIKNHSGVISIHRWRIAHIAVIVLAGILAYANTLHVPFVMDDETISSFVRKDLLEIFLHGGSRRFADVTFALNYHIHGYQVSGYHLVNLAVHLSTSIVLFFLISSAIESLSTTFPAAYPPEDKGTSVERFIPLAVALLFVLHPAQTQAVTYVIQRYTSLATLLYLLSILFFIRGRLAYEKGGLYYPLLLGGISLIAGGLAMGSKQIASTLPLMLLTLEIFLFRGRLINRKFYIASGVVSILVIVFVIVKWSGSSFSDFLYDLHHATSEDPQTSRSTYFLTQTRVVVTYLRLLCLPFGQSIVHDSPVYASLRSAPVIASLALHILLLITAVVLFRQSRQNLLSSERTKGGLQRLASLGIFWFYIALMVESSVFPIMDVIFEHRIYLPSVGFFMSLTACAALLINAWRIPRKVVAPLVVVVCLVLGGLTIARNHVWNDSLTLWQDAVEKSPQNVLALSNLGDVYLERNMPDKAIPLFVRAIELKPDLDSYTKVYLGQALQALNIYGSRFTTGEEFILPDGQVLNYKFASVVFNNLGLANEFLGETDKAKISYGKALKINPAYDLAWFNFGLLSFRSGDRQQAVNSLLQLKILNPALAESLSASMSQ